MLLCDHSCVLSPTNDAFQAEAAGFQHCMLPQNCDRLEDLSNLAPDSWVAWERVLRAGKLGNVGRRVPESPKQQRDPSARCKVRIDTTNVFGSSCAVLQRPRMLPAATLHCRTQAVSQPGDAGNSFFCTSCASRKARCQKDGCRSSWKMSFEAQPVHKVAFYLQTAVHGSLRRARRRDRGSISTFACVDQKGVQILRAAAPKDGTLGRLLSELSGLPAAQIQDLSDLGAVYYRDFNRPPKWRRAKHLGEGALDTHIVEAWPSLLMA